MLSNVTIVYLSRGLLIIVSTIYPRANLMEHSPISIYFPYNFKKILAI